MAAGISQFSREFCARSLSRPAPAAEVARRDECGCAARVAEDAGPMQDIDAAQPWIGTAKEWGSCGLLRGCPITVCTSTCTGVHIAPRLGSASRITVTSTSSRWMLHPAPDSLPSTGTSTSTSTSTKPVTRRSAASPAGHSGSEATSCCGWRPSSRRDGWPAWRWHLLRRPRQPLPRLLPPYPARRC